MGTRLSAACALILAGVLMAGCEGSPSTSPSPTPSASPSAPSSSAPSSPSPPSPAPSGSAAEITVTGQVEQGVEPGCLLIRADGQTYQLVGGDQAILKAGARVTVRGYVVDNVMSHCMQGKPFQVVEVRP